jgi:deazaflavin-dependent oxidoreductase (nitroreductase family)
MNPLFKLFTAGHVALFRATKGRLGSSMMGQRVLLLTTVGNKTGKERTIPLMLFDEDGRHFIIASAGGSPEHPAWFKNLVKRPEVTVEERGRRYTARAQALSGADRAAVWKKVVARAPIFDGYEKKAAPREIPVVELKPS